jgi:hypothetical protein
MKPNNMFRLGVWVINIIINGDNKSGHLIILTNSKTLKQIVITDTSTIAQKNGLGSHLENIDYL